MAYATFIQVGDNVEVPTEWEELLKSAVSATLRHVRFPPPAGMTLLVTDDQEIRQLSRDFLGIDRPTDVLSFSAAESVVAGETFYLGDIAISLPYAAHQAEAAGHSVTAELQLLAIHGVLHLLGYDHAIASEKEAMWGVQTAVLSQLGLAHIHPTES